MVNQTLKKIFEMALTVFLVVFVFTLLVSYNNAGQANTTSAILRRNTPTLVMPAFVQGNLIDSLRKLDVKKEMLINSNDSAMELRAKKRVKVMQAIKELIDNRPKVIIIRDTIPVYIPVPIGDTSFNKLDSLLYNINQN